MKNNILILMITFFFGILLGQENQSKVISEKVLKQVAMVTAITQPHMDGF